MVPQVGSGSAAEDGGDGGVGDEPCGEVAVEQAGDLEAGGVPVRRADAEGVTVAVLLPGQREVPDERFVVADPVAEGMNDGDGAGGPGTGELGVLGVGFGATAGEGVVQRLPPQHLVVAADLSWWLAAVTTGVEEPDPEPSIN